MTAMTVRARLLGVAAIGLTPALAWAQAAPVTPPPATAATGTGAGALTLVAVILGLLVIVGVAVKLYDMKRKREAEAVHLQAQVSDALMREPTLFGMAITPTAHVPFMRGGPATIEVAGDVPSTEVREAALRLVRNEAARMRPDVEVVDRMAVDGTRARRVA